MQPKIIVGCGSGYHNDDLEAAQERLKNAKVYQNLSTVILTPTRGMIPAQVVQNWLFLLGPANAQIGRLFSHVPEPKVGVVMAQGFEVGSAYDHGITTIINDPLMGDAKYILTLEEDNIPPHDGLLKLYENICDCPVPCKEHFVVVSGLYWMKGPMGQPMLFGDPTSDPLDFVPQVPEKDAIQECNGTGMGFALFHAGLFKSVPELQKPWFVTEQIGERGMVKAYTQDLFFMERLRQLGYRIACDTRVKVGHFDVTTEEIW